MKRARGIAQSLAVPQTLVLAVFALLPLHAQAFTLLGGSGLRGWDTHNLGFYVDPSRCPIPEDSLSIAIQAAIDLWNTVPTSSITLSRNKDVGLAPAAVFNANSQTMPSLDTPVIMCDDQLSVTLGQRAGSVSNIAAVSRPDASKSGGPLDFGFILLNAETGSGANIKNLDPTKLSIVIAHEMGHILGLGHTQDRNSIMYFDATSKTHLNLSQDDIDGITYLYPRDEVADGNFFGCSSVDDISKRGGGGGGKSAAELGLLLLACWVGIQNMKKSKYLTN